MEHSSQTASIRVRKQSAASRACTLRIAFLCSLVLCHVPVYGYDFFNLSAIPGPYNFWSYQKLDNGDLISVGGQGDFAVLFADGRKEFRTKVTDEDLYGAYFVDVSHGWVVGTNGSIFRTEDRGKTWTREISGTRADLLGIFCITDSSCWISGREGVLLRLENGLWHFSKTRTSKILWSVYFLDNQVGWAAGEGGLVLRTKDGGRSWVRSRVLRNSQDCDYDYASGPSPTSHLYSIKFATEKLGWVAGLYGLARSADGGRTWNYICLDSASFVGIVSPNGADVYAVGRYGGNFISKDSGLTWVLLRQT